MRVESCSIFVFLCMEAGWWVLPQSHLSSTDTLFKMAFARFFFPHFDCFWRVILVWFCYGLYIMNTNIPRLFIFIKNKAVLYIRTSFIFHSMCRLSNSFPSSMLQCWKSRNGIVIKRLFFFCPTYVIAISLLNSVRPSSAIRAIRYWHTSHNVTDTQSNGSLWKNRGWEREEEKRKKDRECPSSHPLLCLTLCRYGFTQTLRLIRSLGWQTLRQRAAVCSVIHSYTQVSFLRRLCVCVCVCAWRPTNSHVAPSAARLW